MVRRQTATAFFILVFLSMLLAACWDKTELNELALVSMIGVDSDPESGVKTVYFQVVNPLSSSSAKGPPNSDQAPVYTYEIKGKSYGEMNSTIYKVLPRRLFIAHYKAIIVSERAAKQGVREIVNFIEMQPNGRASVPLLISDEPLSPFMHTLTPLERVPSDALDSRLRQLTRHSLITGKRIMVNNVIERMENEETIVLPLVTSQAENVPADSGETAANINAKQNNFTIGGGAVLQDYRMVGRLNDKELIWYHLLNGEKGRQALRFLIDGKRTSLEWKLVRLERTVHWQQGQPVVRIHLSLELSSALSSEYVPETRRKIIQLEDQVNRIMTDELNAFQEKMKTKGWDLLRIEKLLQRSRLPGQQHSATTAKNAKVVISVTTKLSQVGMNTPY